MFHHCCGLLLSGQTLLLSKYEKSKKDIHHKSNVFKMIRKLINYYILTFYVQIFFFHIVFLVFYFISFFFSHNNAFQTEELSFPIF